MIFEAIEPLRITTRTLGILSLSPGQCMDLPDKAVLQLLKQMPERIRVIDESLNPQPGLWVTFNSPLFGICGAKIKQVESTQIMITDHSVIGTQAGLTIDPRWIQHLSKEKP